MATHISNTPSGVNEPGLPIDMQEVIARLAMHPEQTETFLAGLANALIEEQDRLEPDPDLEDGADTEPNCGGTGTYAYNDECEPDDDGEWSLGWHAGMSQTRLGEGTDDGDETALERHGTGFLRTMGGDDVEDGHDLEQVCEDEGADIQAQPHDAETDEPSLGSPEIHHDQRRWGQGKGSLEIDHDERTDLAAFGWEERSRRQAARESANVLIARSRRSPCPWDGSDVVILSFADARR